MSERVFERVNRHDGAEGSLVHQADLDGLLDRGWCTSEGASLRASESA